MLFLSVVYSERTSTSVVFCCHIVSRSECYRRRWQSWMYYEWGDSIVCCKVKAQERRDKDAQWYGVETWSRLGGICKFRFRELLWKIFDVL